MNPLKLAAALRLAADALEEGAEEGVPVPSSAPESVKKARQRPHPICTMVPPSAEELAQATPFQVKMAQQILRRRGYVPRKDGDQ